MEEAEFDRFADEYVQLHAKNVRLSGETPEFFARYKIADVARWVVGGGAITNPAILDFGAGVGTSVPYFREYFPGARLTCLDVSHKSLDIGLRRFRGQAEFVHFDGSTVPFEEETFDLVFLACVLHHIPHDRHEHILCDLQRVLRAGGALVVFEHNPFNPLTVHAVNTCPFDENAVLLNPRSLRRNVKRAGFDDVRTIYRLFFPSVLRSLRPLEQWMTWLPLGAQYFIHARKP